MEDVVYTVKLPKGMTVEANGVLVIGIGESVEEKETA